MNSEIITIGTELLTGNILNSNLKYLARELITMGFNISKHIVIDNSFYSILNAVKESLLQNDLIILTGGLGSGKKDLTKETVAKILYENLEDLKISESTVFYNELGMSSGMAIKYKNKHILLLPTSSNELNFMFEKYVKKYIAKSTNQIVLLKDIHLFGIDELKVNEILSDIFFNSNPYIGIYSDLGEIKIRVVAKSQTQKECENLINSSMNIIQMRLGSYIYGINIKNMQNALVKTAIKFGKKIAVAESCTGGLIASEIVSISGSSKCFDCGIVCYSNKMKEQILGVKKETLAKFGAVSMQVAEQMADGVRKISNSDIGISTTGIAGPTGQTQTKPIGLVYVGISTVKATNVYKLLLSNNQPYERQKIRKISTLFAMNEARKAILSKI